VTLSGEEVTTSIEGEIITVTEPTTQQISITVPVTATETETETVTVPGEETTVSVPLLITLTVPGPTLLATTTVTSVVRQTVYVFQNK
jgi:hypothetical protein